MASPETKTVLGRVFTRIRWGASQVWGCQTKHGLLTLDHLPGSVVEACLSVGTTTIADSYAPTESDAILALQATLRKMAELEVERG